MILLGWILPCLSIAKSFILKLKYPGLAEVWSGSGDQYSGGITTAPASFTFIRNLRSFFSSFPSSPVAFACKSRDNTRHPPSPLLKHATQWLIVMLNDDIIWTSFMVVWESKNCKQEDIMILQMRVSFFVFHGKIFEDDQSHTIWNDQSSSSSKTGRRRWMVILGFAVPSFSLICSSIDIRRASETWQRIFYF